MANYNLVIDSKFNPISFDDRMKPYLMYKEESDKTMDALSELQTKASIWENMANEQSDPIAYARYKAYSDNLNKQIDNIIQNGYTASAKMGLMALKANYSKRITPIEQAYAKREQANEFRDKAGPDAIFKIDRYTSLDDFMNGEIADNSYLSKAAIIKESADITQAAMQEALKDPEFKKTAGNQYWQITQHTGGSYEDMKKAFVMTINSIPEANNRFMEIKQQLLQKYDAKSYGLFGQKAIAGAIDYGLYSGLDKPAISFQANNDLQRALDAKRLAADKETRAANSTKESNNGSNSGKGNNTNNKQRDLNRTAVAFSKNGDRYDYVTNSDYLNKLTGQPVKLEQLIAWGRAGDVGAEKAATYILSELDGRDPNDYDFSWHTSQWGYATNKESIDAKYYKLSTNGEIKMPTMKNPYKGKIIVQIFPKGTPRTQNNNTAEADDDLINAAINE